MLELVHVAFTKACIALPEQMSSVQSRSTEPGQSFGIQSTPFYHVPKTFDEETFELQLPFFLEQHDGPDIEFTDFKGNVRLTSDKRVKGDRDYEGLWNMFLAKTHRNPPTKGQIPSALEAWHRWAQNQLAIGSLSRHQAEVCHGPERSVKHFERARVGPAQFVTNRLEGAKKARDSVILSRSRDGAKLVAGRVRAFLCHSAPGVDPDPDNETYIADVKWYAQVADNNVAAHTSMKALKCPIFRSSTPDRKQGNLWPVSQLVQAKFATLAHHSGKDNVVVLTRFQSAIPKL